VLGGGGDADGLVVLLRGGIVAWLRAQASVLSAMKAAPENPVRRDAHADPERADLVRLLANIISQHLTEEAA
jgi:hypothetical protein